LHNNDIADKGGIWTEVSQEGLNDWDIRLQNTAASLYQYPFWNEPFRRLFFKPRYLLYKCGDKEISFVSILTIGFSGIRIGLIRYGPVCLDENEKISKEAWFKLKLWAKRHGYIFLRITNSNEQALEIVSSMDTARRIDAFPLYPEDPEELIAPMHVNENQMISEFDHEVRRQIRRAQEVGYQIVHSESPESFSDVWPLAEAMVTRKQINCRPFSYYHNLMICGTRAKCCRLYMAKFDDKAVQGIIVARCGKVAYYIFGALDVGIMPNNHSPSYLLHMHAMRDFINLGAEFYHVGNRANRVYQFKKKFKPVEYKTAVPVTLITNPFLYSLWSMSILKLGQPSFEWIRKIVQSFKQ
jgi:hypothetical protein